MESIAHKLSQKQVIDPAYSSNLTDSKKTDSEEWLYSAAQYEAFMKSHTDRVAESVGLSPEYSSSPPVNCSLVFFRRFIEPGNLEIFVNGNTELSLDNANVEVLDDEESGSIIVMNSSEGDLLVKVTINEDFTSIPSIKAEGDDWEVSLNGIDFEQPERLPNANEFGFELIDVDVASLEKGKYDVKREIYGYVSVRSKAKPSVHLADSLAEIEYKRSFADAAPARMVRTHTGSWRTSAPVFFRYFSVESSEEFTVTCEAQIRPMEYKGAFHADDELNRIWMSAAYTLRVCTRDVIASGDPAKSTIPPMATLAVGTMANAYVFAEPDPVRDTLRLAAQYGIDATSTENRLWYIFCHDMYQLYFDDREFLEESYDDIKSTLFALSEAAKANDGILPGVSNADEGTEGPSTTLQMIYIMALQSAERIADRMEDVAESELCHETAEALKDKLVDIAFNDNEGLFFSKPGDPSSPVTRHANFLSIVSGFAEEDLAQHISDILLDGNLPAVKTPFMAFFEIMALYMGGRSDEALGAIRRWWGGMLRAGATTFFESFDPDAVDGEIYAKDGDPFGNCLCHASACGPAALLPIVVFGFEPMADGWKERFNAEKSPLGEANLTVPTPDGAVMLESKEGVISIQEAHDPIQ